MPSSKTNTFPVAPSAGAPSATVDSERSQAVTSAAASLAVSVPVWLQVVPDNSQTGLTLLLL
jgi:hypothetical protein